MILLEALLITLLLVTLIISSYTDCKFGTIKNKVLLFSTIVTLIFDIYYYTVLANEYIYVFVQNVILFILIGIILYSINIWAAGDSKLLMYISLAVPGRISCLRDDMSISAIIGIAFAIAYIYILLNAIIDRMKRKNICKKKKNIFDYKKIILYYSATVLMLNIIKEPIAYICSFCAHDTLMLRYTIYIMTVLIMLFVRNKFNIKSIKIINIILIFMAGTMIYKGYAEFDLAYNYYFISIIILLIALRIFIIDYSYKEILVQDIKKGDILSTDTVFRFYLSNIKGLPSGISEDYNSKISDNEVKCIKIWSNSRFGSKTVTIIRKLSFAIYLLLGTIVFLILEVYRT